MMTQKKAIVISPCICILNATFCRERGQTRELEENRKCARTWRRCSFLVRTLDSRRESSRTRRHCRRRQERAADPSPFIPLPSYFVLCICNRARSLRSSLSSHERTGPRFRRSLLGFSAARILYAEKFSFFLRARWTDGFRRGTLHTRERSNANTYVTI